MNLLTKQIKKRVEFVFLRVLKNILYVDELNIILNWHYRLAH